MAVGLGCRGATATGRPCGSSLRGTSQAALRIFGHRQKLRPGAAFQSSGRRGDARLGSGDATMAMKTMDDLFLMTLKDIYYAERQLLKALPKMARAAQNDELKQAFKDHKEQTEGQVERLQQVFQILGKRAQGVTCEAIQGLIQEAEELLEEAPEPSAVRDAGLIASGQAVEHYEMARYGTLLAWAEAQKKPDIAELLKATLEEEKATDKLLTQMAVKTIHREALKAA
ncbi:ferritin-like domain-containing protein [Falsiroseomonas sp. E2-1-a4]|uniref:YciE/YciF ferroxidase family protein n=1 Tax=Falsiroseomonas sp. E2-1-a4 TaxID=3239299 RepID=UPI003F2DA936